MRTHDAEWQIKRAEVVAPALENGGVTVYSANGNSILLNGFAADKMEFNGNGLTLEEGKTLRIESEQGTVAGNYPFTVTAGGNYCFDEKDSASFGTVLTVDLTWTIQRQGVAKPTEPQEYTYGENDHQYALAEGVAAYSVTSEARRNAGKYDVVFALDPNYCWGCGRQRGYGRLYSFRGADRSAFRNARKADDGRIRHRL